MRLFFAFFVSVNKKDKFSSFISTDFINKKEKMCFRDRRTSVAVGFP